MTDLIDHRREFLDRLEQRDDVEGTDFTRDGFRTVFVEPTEDADVLELIEIGEEYGYSGLDGEGARRVVFEAVPEGSASEKVRLGGNRLSYLPSDRNLSSTDTPKKSSEGQGSPETSEWDPSPARLRDGEHPDRDTHAQRNLEQLRMADRELEEEDDGDD